MKPPETALDHIARAKAIHADCAVIAKVLERQGMATSLALIEDRTLAGVLLGIAMKGTLPEARKQAALIKAVARERGFELYGGVIELIREGLAPDEWRIGLHSTVRRARAPRQRAV